jgi:ATP-dependent DNA helicase RecG
LPVKRRFYKKFMNIPLNNPDISPLRYNRPMNFSDTLEESFRLDEPHKKALKRFGIITIRDLFYHFPARYDNMGQATDVSTITKGQKATLYGTMTKPKASKGWKTKVTMTQATIATSGGKIKAVWFHQPYIAKMFPEGALVKVDGTVSERNGELYLSNPAIEHASVIPENSETLFSNGQGAMDKGQDADESLSTAHSPSSLFPVYPETKGITSRWFYYTIQKAIKAGVLDTVVDPIPADMLKQYNLPTLGTALVWMHAPERDTEATAARKRFAFEEIFFIQLAKQQERHANDELPTWDIRPTKEQLDGFLSRFPFTPTSAQSKALKDILADLAGSRAMSRLLEGDVGSGKTFVAAATSFAVVTTRPNKDPLDATRGKQDFGNLQVAVMAPTEILATQHFESFVELYRELPIQVALITSSGCKKFPSKVNPNGWTDISRTQLLKWVANGEIPIVIGTHSLIQKTVVFKHLACVIIDEQHRFGTKQRKALARKDEMLPHLLSMTATPIPRTLALTIYGDLDLSLLDVLPPGRKPIITTNVPPSNRNKVYEHLRQELVAGRQAYVICPRIDEPDETNEMAMIAKSVEAEAARLAREVFPEFSVGSLHGKMTPKKKEETMEAFTRGDIDILVATSVIEVGVNVPNATIIIIEGAERFGLSQLHQLRGRVLRSSHQAHCYLFTETKSSHTLDRLKALTEAKNGFELAERDLMLRGAGDLAGKKQWGVSDIGMEALKNLKLVEAARAEAKQLVEADMTLKKYPELQKALAERSEMHFE